MADKPPEDKNGLLEILNRIWLPIAGFVGAITLIYNFYKLWQGDQETVTIILVIGVLVIWFFMLLWIGFSKITKDGRKSRGKKSSQIPRYPKFQQPARIALIATLITVAIGGLLLQRQRAELINKIIVVIATFDGPEEEYGVRNQIIEELNISLADLDDVKIIPINEIITPAQGSEHARKIGLDYQADIVLWGWYKPTENPNFILHVENISSQELPILADSSTLRPQATLADLESFSLQQRLGAETSGLIIFLTGFIEYDLGNYFEALDRFNIAIDYLKQAQVSSKNLANAYFYHGNTSYYVKEYNQSIIDYTQVIEIDSEFHDAYTNRGMLYSIISQYDKALIDLNQAIQLDPQVSDDYINRGNVYDYLGQYDKALKDFNYAIEIDPASFEAYINRGIVYQRLNEFEKALTDYNQAIQLNPHPDAYYNRGLTYAELKQFTRAIVDYEFAIKLNPQDPDYYGARGDAYKANGQYDQAIADYKTVIQIDPNNAMAYDKLGNAYADLKDYTQAIHFYNLSIQINPQNADTHYNRGVVYSSLGNHEQAIIDYSQAIQLNPGLAAAYINRGNEYSATGKHDQAISDYSYAIQLNPQIAIAYLNRGLSYQILGLEDEAQADFQKYSELSGQSP